MSLKQTLFGRDSNVNQLEDAPAWRVGASMSATWSWGAAIAVAIAVMHGKGFIPFLAWMTANMVAIPTFGLAYTYIPHLRKWKNLLPMLALWLFIGFFAIIMNMSALMAALGGGVGGLEAYPLLTDQQALYATLGVGVLIAWYIHKKGLRGSVTTDMGQLTLQFAGVIGIIVVGLATGARADIQMYVGDQSAWMVTAVLGLLSGCVASGMQWQRIEAVPEEKKLKSTLWGGAIFSTFMLLTIPAGLVFDGSLLVSIPFLVAVLAVASSTSDSGVALLQYVGERFKLPPHVGSLMGIAAVAIFPFVATWGITGIWTFYASTRWKVIAVLLVGTLIYTAIRRYVPVSVYSVARRMKLVLDTDVTGEKVTIQSDD